MTVLYVGVESKGFRLRAPGFARTVGGCLLKALVSCGGSLLSQWLSS